MTNVNNQMPVDRCLDATLDVAIVGVRDSTGLNAVNAIGSLCGMILHVVEEKRLIHLVKKGVPVGTQESADDVAIFANFQLDSYVFECRLAKEGTCTVTTSIGLERNE